MPSPADSPEVQIRQALRLLQQGYPAPAESLCRQALAAQPGSIGGLSILGLALNAQHPLPGCVAGIRRADPTQFRRALALGQSGDGPARADRRFDEALSAYARAAQLGEASPDFSTTSGSLHFDRGDFVSARDVLGTVRTGWRRTTPRSLYYAAQCFV